MGKFSPHKCFDKSYSFLRGDILSPDINLARSVYDAVGGKEGARNAEMKRRAPQLLLSQCFILNVILEKENPPRIILAFSSMVWHRGRESMCTCVDTQMGFI